MLYLPARRRRHEPVRALRPAPRHCPYKGDANYFSLRVGDRTAADAVWTYETPLDDVAAIAGHLAFYPDRVDAIEEVNV